MYFKGLFEELPAKRLGIPDKLEVERQQKITPEENPPSIPFLSPATFSPYSLTQKQVQTSGFSLCIL